MMMVVLSLLQLIMVLVSMLVVEEGYDGIVSGRIEILHYTDYIRQDAMLNQLWKNKFCNALKTWKKPLIPHEVCSILPVCVFQYVCL